MKRYILFLKKEEDTFVKDFAAGGKISQMTETCWHHGTSEYKIQNIKKSDL